MTHEPPDDSRSPASNSQVEFRSWEVGIAQEPLNNTATLSPEAQAEIAQARALLSSPPKTNGGLVWLLVGFVLFLMTAGQRNLWDLGVIIAVLIIHEAGHLLGMKLFGFSDLRMFFIPFFGAAASGRKFGASSFEHAVVLLLGPLPGIVIGSALLIATFFTQRAQLADVGFMFTIINAFNLIPVSPFDGGRLFERLLFNRRYWLEFLFRLLAIASLAGLAILLREWIFGLLAGFLLLGFSIHMKRARAGFSLVSRMGHLPSNPHDLSDGQVLALLESVRDSLNGIKANGKTLATLRTQATQELFDRASTQFASLAATAICLTAWAGALFLSVVNIVLWAFTKNMPGLN